jgi:hypothetical protein
MESRINQPPKIKIVVVAVLWFAKSFVPWQRRFSGYIRMAQGEAEPLSLPKQAWVARSAFGAARSFVGYVAPGLRFLLKLFIFHEYLCQIFPDFISNNTCVK